MLDLVGAVCLLGLYRALPACPYTARKKEFLLLLRGMELRALPSPPVTPGTTGA